MSKALFQQVFVFAVLSLIIASGSFTSAYFTAQTNTCDGADTNTDPRNSGACGRRCVFANAYPSCSAGQCGVAGCNAGFGNCDANGANGCEVNLNNDFGNCGMCGNRCAFPHANAVCSYGRCAIGSCAPGYYDLNRDRTDGCESTSPPVSSSSSSSRAASSSSRSSSLAP